LLVLAACAVPAAHDDAMETPLAAAGDAARGREVFVAREGGHCVLCHAVPGVDVAGDVGPPLTHAGSKFTPAQLRLRVADISRVRPLAAMPTFHRTENLTRVAASYQGKPVLSGQQVEDLVAYLSTLR
jgi:sulfur-oxidizing protein SoxX